MAITLRGLHPEVRQYAELAHQWANAYGINPTVTSTFRTWENQVWLRRRFERCVREGRFPGPGPCRFPANRPGDSAHNFGLAWDSVVPPDDQPLWNAIRRAVGFRVPDNDQIHAEVPGWRDFV